MAKITMLLGSMDHSPSEQLGKDPTEWHTTAIIASEGGEHLLLADDIANRMKIQGGTLKRWARNPPGSAYRAKFEATFAERASSYPVHVRAVSVQSETMVRAFPNLLTHLQLASYVEAFTRNNKPYLRFGPFTRMRAGAPINQQGEPVKFELPESQAVPIVFMCHSLLHAHRSVMQELVADSPELEWIDWQLTPNKFPRDIDGPVARLFHAIISLAEDARMIEGNLRILTLLESKQDHGSALADNLAGLLNQKAKALDWTIQKSPTKHAGSSVLWTVCHDKVRLQQ
ncbi:MAG TPA: hypothetical protein VG742_02880 [Dongiaceae bacterium]|nr:hypothetical protein [Dongiaceae bacterium]